MSNGKKLLIPALIDTSEIRYEGRDHLGGAVVNQWGNFLKAETVSDDSSNENKSTSLIIRDSTGLCEQANTWTISGHVVSADDPLCLSDLW